MEGATGSSDTFIEEQPVLNLGNSTAFDGGRVRDDRIQVEFLVVNLIRNTKRAVLVNSM